MASADRTLIVWEGPRTLSAAKAVAHHAARLQESDRFFVLLSGRS